MAKLSVITSKDQSYESARVDRVFNLRRPSKYPEGIVFPSSEDEGEF